MAKVFVGNIDYQVDDAALASLFEENGFPVEQAIIIKDRVSEQSRGFGFVTLKNEHDKERAIEMMNGHKVGTRKLTVNEAKPEVRGAGHHGGQRRDRDDYRRR